MTCPAPFPIGSGRNYNGSSLSARANVIVVTLNYRLGPLGYLTHDEIATALAPTSGGMNGLLDVEAAVAFLRKHAQAFGADPSAITIGGESAGACFLCMLAHSAYLQSMALKGVVLESGACTSSFCRPRTQQQSRRASVRFARMVTRGDPNASLAALQAIPLTTLLARAGSSGCVDSWRVW